MCEKRAKRRRGDVASGRQHPREVGGQRRSRAGRRSHAQRVRVETTRLQRRGELVDVAGHVASATVGSPISIVAPTAVRGGDANTVELSGAVVELRSACAMHGVRCSRSSSARIAARRPRHRSRRRLPWWRRMAWARQCFAPVARLTPGAGVLRSSRAGTTMVSIGALEDWSRWRSRRSEPESAVCWPVCAAAVAGCVGSFAAKARAP